MIKQGPGGSVAVSRARGPRLGTLRLRVMQTSPSNSMLQALCDAQDAPGFSAYPIAQLHNLQGGENVIMPRAVITKEPEIGYSDGIEVREWTLKGLATQQAAGFEI